MKKSLMSFAIGLLSTYSCWAFGLSLGEIQLKSNLNEPLRAEINLTQVRGLTPQELLVGLAPKEDFEANKVERVFYLADLKFRVEIKSKDTATIYVTSGKAIQEPYLNFLVEVNWPAGRLVREYTLLIDPPTRTQDAVAQPIARTKSQDVLARVPEKKIENVSSPVASSSFPSLPVAPTAQKAVGDIQRKVPEGKKEHASVAPKASAASKTAALEAPKPAPSSPKAAAKVYEANDGKGYTVQQNETLWDIAVKIKPDGVSLHQTIVALYQTNSAAFIQQNMNLVKKGAVLRVPSAEDAKKITRQDAIEEMARQSKLWQAKVQVKSASQLTAENIDASGRADRVVSSAKDTNDGKLTLASTEGSSSGSGEGKGKAGGGVNTTLLEERLDQVKLQNTDLSQSVKELSQQVKTSEKVLKLKDDKIAVLEAKLKQLEDRNKHNAKDYNSAKEKTESVKSVLEEVKSSAQASTIPSTTGFASSEPVVTTSDLTGAASIDTITSAESLAPAIDSLGGVVSDPVTTAAAPDQPQALEEPPAADDDNALYQTPEDQEAQKMQEETQEEVPASDVEASLIDQLLENPLYLAAAATVVAVVVGVFVMRRRRPESEEDLTDEEMMEAAEQGFTQDELVGENPVLDEETDSNDKKSNDKKSVVQEDTVVQSASSAPIIDVQDIIGEADIFLAYGRFDQAAGILQKTIKQIPNDTSLRLKLMEVFVESRDVEGFLLQEKAITSLGDPEIIHKAQQLRKRLGVTSEAAQRLSQEMLGAGVEEEIHSATDEEISAESTQEEESGMLTQNSADLPSLSDLESSLTHGLDEEEKEQENATALSNMGTGESDGLDFDLNLDDDEDDQVKQKNNETLIDSISQMPSQAGSSASDSVIDEDAFELDLSLIESDDKSNTKSSEFQLDLNELDDLDIQPLSIDTSFDTKAVSPNSAESDLNFDLIDLDQDDVLSTPAAPPTSAALASKTSAPAGSFSGQNANDLDDDFSFLESTDQVSNSLDLAKAYLDMGDIEGAKDILTEVLEQGDTKQKDEARTLLKKIPKHG